MKVGDFLKTHHLALPLVVLSLVWVILYRLDRGESEPQADGQTAIRTGAEVDKAKADRIRKIVRERTLASSEAQRPISKNKKHQSVSQDSAQALSRFQQLSRKALMSGLEAKEKRGILSQRKVLLELGRLLQNPSNDPDIMNEQDVAVDLLLEALQEGAVDTASAVLSQVVKDGQIENLSLDANIRGHLAGIKGEILYHWVAIEPQQEAQVSGLLPGPVSRKIWQNVQEVHAANAAESQEEVEHFH